MKFKKCAICSTEQNVELHHCYFGKNRKVSDKHGFTVYLCAEHHRGQYSPHRDSGLDLYFKQVMQEEYEKLHSREEFIKLIGRSYL